MLFCTNHWALGMTTGSAKILNRVRINQKCGKLVKKIVTPFSNAKFNRWLDQ